MINGNYIKVNRSILNWEWYDDINTFKVFMHLLLTVNWKDGQWRGKTIKRGQRVVSLEKLSEETKLSKMQIRSTIKKLILTQEITQEKMFKTSLFTVINYDKYQTDNTNDNTKITLNEPVKQHRNNIVITSIEESKEGEEGKEEKNNKVVDLADKKANNDYQKIVDMYNEICISYPRLKKLSESRKKAIKARLNSYSMDDFKEMFEAAERSDFLKGKNDRNWSATFDWLLKDSNMTKVLEGNYNNKGEGKQQGQQPKKEGEIDFYDVQFYEQFKNKSK